MSSIQYCLSYKLKIIFVADQPADSKIYILKMPRFVSKASRYNVCQIHILKRSLLTALWPEVQSSEKPTGCSQTDKRHFPPAAFPTPINA